ncbi:4-hydroxy-tetrahydrodipicolinate reductase [bacterium]|nr:4-hydroxy-tetrahydrodipicolinate reductase [bacterium]
MINVIVNGACGRMGRRIINLLSIQKDLHLCGAVEILSHSDIGKDVGVIAGIDKSGVKVSSCIKDVIKDADVVVDFSSTDGVLASASACAKYKKALIVGTTGLGVEALSEIRNISHIVACLVSSNMSVGVNLLCKLVEQASSILGDEYDVEIIEAHHRFKKDAPSGTAKTLAEIISKVKGRQLEDVAVYGRRGFVGEKKQNEIGIHAVRAGDIVGEHTVIFGGTGERIELKHIATTRDTFAQGVIKAIKFISTQRAGLYDMKDVLNRIKD